MCGENNYMENNIKTLNLDMNKDQLARLQDKVNRLMRTSSEDSDPENIITIAPQNHQNTFSRESEPETVRKCIDLIKQNKELKIALEKEKNKNEELRKEVVKARTEKRQQKQAIQLNSRQENKTNKLQQQHYRKLGKIQAELQQQKKRNLLMQKMLMLQRKKNKTLSRFLSKNVPDIESTLDKLMAGLDAKLQAHFSRLNN